jgi:integrase
MQTRLTDIVIRNTKPPAQGQLDVMDTVLPCFGVRIGPRKRMYFVTYRQGGKRRRVQIGDATRMSLAEARKAADVKLTMAHGSGLSETRTTFRQAFELYLAEPSERARWKDPDRTATAKRREFELYDTPLFDRPIDGIQWQDARKLINDLYGRAPIAANRHLSTLKRFFGWCVKVKLIDRSPVVDIDKPAREVSRDRVMTEDEVQRFWRATETVGLEFRDVFRLQLITAQRRDEVLGMSWREVDVDERVWQIPAERAKNDRATTVPLTPLALDLLNARSRTSALVFPSTNKRSKRPLSGYSKATDRVRSAMGVDDVRFHDLRRTTATHMAGLGVPPHVVEAILNHKTGVVKGVAAVYNRYQYLAEKRAALDAWSDRLRAIVS